MSQFHIFMFVFFKKIFFYQTFIRLLFLIVMKLNSSLFSDLDLYCFLDNANT